MSRVAGICVIALLVASPVRAHATNSPREIVLADELRTAFYEHAPSSLATEMSKAVISWCSSGQRTVVAEVTSWLCGAKTQVYFRGIYVNGSKGSHGLVCENNGTSKLKYFGMDLVADLVAHATCVPADYDGSIYVLYVETLGGGHT